MAFQNEPRFMAAWRLSKVFSSDGSITASRFMSTLEVRLISLSLRLMLARPAFFTQAKAALIPGALNNREIKKAT